EEVKKLNKKERRSYRKFESECLELKWLDRTDEELPKIDDPQLYDKFLRIINLILLYCRKLKLPQNNKVIQKYKKLKTEINDLPNLNKFVIECSIKF
ncbi:26609_t:CDS:2, partial [Gigaspora margarita]